VDDDLAVAGNFRQTARNVVLGDELSANLGNLIFVWLANVEDVEVFAGVDAALEFLHG
jgi:hypothetical protein